MKRTTALTAIALLFLSGAAYGEGSGISFRLSGGGAWGRYSHPPLISYPGKPDLRIGITYGDRIGLAGGAGCEIALPFSERLSSVTSVEYIRKGAQVVIYEPAVGIFANDRYEARHSLRSYEMETLSLIQLLKVKPLPGGFPYALAGFELARVLSHGFTETPGLSEAPLTDDTRKIDFGLVAGAGGELNAGRWASFLEVRYHLGLVNLSKAAGALQNYPTLKTRAVSLIFGLRYRLGKAAS